MLLLTKGSSSWSRGRPPGCMCTQARQVSASHCTLKDQSPSCVCIPSASMHQPVEMHAPTSAAMMPRAALPTATASRDQMLTSTLSWEPDASSPPGSMMTGTRLVMKSLVRMVRPVSWQQRGMLLLMTARGDKHIESTFESSLCLVSISLFAGEAFKPHAMLEPAGFTQSRQGVPCSAPWDVPDHQPYGTLIKGRGRSSSLGSPPTLGA